MDLQASQFVKADSANLPKVDSVMIVEYLTNSDNHNIAELRGAKAMMSSRDSYLENAVGYVELNRDHHCCKVKARIVPEHRIALKCYNVHTEIDEINEQIIDTTCDDCPAAAGGCKHALVLLFWLQKRSSEPASTSIVSYWRKPRLSNLRHDFILAADLYPNAKKVKRDPKQAHILKNFIEKCKNNSKLCENALIMKYMVPKLDSDMSAFCIFNLLLACTTETSQTSFTDFKKYCNNALSKEVKDKIVQNTTEQSQCAYWHNVRQGRITASKLHEVANCRTPDGALVQEILGGYKVIETQAMKRGKLLEDIVIKKIEDSFKSKINKAGFYVDNTIFGASPDGIFSNNRFIVEVKCPSSAKTKELYVKNNKVTAKCMAQVQLQMHCTNIKKCLFCVADEKFEENNKLTLIFVDYDKEYLLPVLEKAETFYKENIFPKLLKNVLK